MHQNINVAIFLPDLRGGGVERVRLLLADEFVRQGHEVEFVLMRSRGELLGEARDKFPIVELCVDRLREVPLRLVRYLRQRRPTALLTAMWPLTGIAGVANRVAGRRTRVVVSEHVDLRYSPSLKKIDRLVLRQFGRRLYSSADGVVAVSNGVADSIGEFTGMPREAVSVIYNPIRCPNAVYSEPAFESDCAWWRAATHKLITVGSLKSQKGHRDLLNAFATLCREMSGCRLLIVGEGPLRAAIEAHVVELGLEDKVRVPGFDRNPYAYLKHADLFVLASHYEGLGNVITEALAAGVPVVSTDCPSGPREILADGRFGLLTPPKDPQSLAAAMQSALHAERDRCLLTARAKDFSPAIAAEKYLNLLSPRR